MKRLATVTPLHYFRRTTPDPETGCWPFNKRGSNKAGHIQVWHPSVPHRTGEPRLRVSLHRLIWELAKGPIPPGMHVLHHCDNPPCINPDHLFLGTHQDNMDDKVRKNRQMRGERQRFAKMTAETVRAIRERYTNGERNKAALAREFGITPPNASYIINRKTWKHV